MKITIPDNAKKILERLKQNNFEAFVVGGCVRDSVLGLTPHDWDMCTDAEPRQTKSCFKDFITFDTGIKHGTVSVKINKDIYEVTTYRIDGEYSDNRHPENVIFTTEIEKDLARRDFTVNAMAFNDDRGIVDPFGGMDDLRNKLVRCVGNPDERFGEDALRILRALRFASCYNFSIDEETSISIHKNRALLNNIAAERIREELIRLICGAGTESILNEYRDVLAVFIPEISDCFDFAQRNIHHKYDVFRHITHSVGIVEGTPLLRMTMLLHDIGKPCVCAVDADGTCHFKGHQQVGAEMAEVILKRLRFPNSFIEDCLKLIIYHDVRFNGSKKQVKHVLNKLGEENMRLLFKVQYADTMAQSEYLRAEKLKKIRTAHEMFEKIIEDNQCVSLKQLAVNGNDLKSSGISDGIQIGRILNQLLEEVIDEKIDNEKSALLSKAKKLYNSSIE